MSIATTEQENYQKYRGKCREESEKLAKENPSLRVVRGWYYEIFWNRREAHWWCVDQITGEIIDPTALQFPSAGNGVYGEFDGYYECSFCGKQVAEEDIVSYGRHVYCSNACMTKDLLG